MVSSNKIYELLTCICFWKAAEEAAAAVNVPVKCIDRQRSITTQNMLFSI